MLAIKKSTIPDAGLGVFSTKFIQPNTVVTQYDGRPIDEPPGNYGICTWSKFVENNLSDEEVAFIILHQRYKLGNVYGYTLRELIQKWRGNFIYHCGSLLNHSKTPNCRIEEKGIVTTKPIRPGTELFIDYGTPYWEGHRRFDEANEKYRTIFGESVYEWIERSIKDGSPIMEQIRDIASAEKDMYNL